MLMEDSAARVGVAVVSIVALFCVAMETTGFRVLEVILVYDSSIMLTVYSRDL